VRGGYPYLDRGLLEFLYAIPREPNSSGRGQRPVPDAAVPLKGIVPDQILERKRKAFISRGPSAIISAEWAQSGSKIKAVTWSGVPLGIVARPTLPQKHCAQGSAKEQRSRFVPLNPHAAVLEFLA